MRDDRAGHRGLLFAGLGASACVRSAARAAAGAAACASLHNATPAAGCQGEPVAGPGGGGHHACPDACRAVRPCGVRVHWGSMHARRRERVQREERACMHA